MTTVDQELHRTLSAVPRSVSVARREVAHLAAQAGASDEALHSIRLAVSEAMSNAVLHAYDGRDRPGPVHVAAIVMDDEVVVTISDEGRGMTPRPDSPGLGLGLPVIAQCSDSVDIHIDGHGGTAVRMAFRLTSQAAVGG